MNTQLALIIAVGIVFLVAVLTIVIILQRRQIKKLEEPRYGFLGKPLPALITTLVLGAGLVGSVYLVNQDQTTVDTEATVEIEISYTKELIAQNGVNTYLFRAVPSINSEAYGGTNGGDFDIFWNFTGPQRLAESEVGVTGENPSEIQVSLQRGTYDLIILVQYFDPASNQTYSETLKETVVL
jgi:preprotein translocase subunit YajC